MGTNDNGLDLVLEALRDVSESNRKAIESVNALQIGAAQTKAEHEAAIRAAKESSDRMFAAVTELNRKITESQAAFEAKIKSYSDASEARISGIEGRLRSVEQGYAESRVIPVTGLNDKLSDLTKKHEGLYSRFTTISAISGAIVSVIVTLVAKYLMQNGR